jgi:hypothetical protein
MHSVLIKGDAPAHFRDVLIEGFHCMITLSSVYILQVLILTQVKVSYSAVAAQIARGLVINNG